MSPVKQQFGDYELLGPQGPLLAKGEFIKLQPKATALLWLLLQRVGDIVTKAELLDALWPNQTVSEEALSFQIRKLRQALDDNAQEPKYIATVHRLGFRFVGTDATLNPIDPPSGNVFAARQSELQQLNDAVAASDASSCKLLFVTGEPGIGKTALIQHFIEQQNAGILVGVGHCHEHSKGREPYGVLLDALGGMLRHVNHSQLIEELRSQAPSWLARVPGLMSANESRTLKNPTSRLNSERMLAEWLQALACLCRYYRLVVVLEDLHWSDPESLDILAATAKAAAGLPLLVVASYRPVDAILTQHPSNTLKQKLSAEGHAVELAVPAFSADEATVYLQAALQPRAISQDICRQLHKRSHGHPLYLAQLLSTISSYETIDANTVERVLRSVPQNLRELIGNQIDRLGEQRKQLLEHAAIIGADFSVELLAASLTKPLDEVEALCTELAANRQIIQHSGILVWPDGTVASGYRFSHDLYREVLAAQVPEINAARICAAIATRLEQAYGHRCGQVASQLASYFGRAGQDEKSLDYHVLAAYESLNMGAIEQASKQANLAKTRLDLLTQAGPQARPELVLATVRVHIGLASGGFSAVELERELARLRLLLPKVQDVALRENVLGVLWITSFFNSKHAEAARYAEQATTLGRQSKSPALECAGLAWHSLGAHVVGQDQLSLDLGEQAIALTIEHDWDPTIMGHAEPGCAAISSCAQSLWTLGRPDAALERAFEGVARAEMINNASIRCSTVGTSLGGIYLARREAHKLLQNCEDISPLCQECGQAESLAWITKFKAIALCLLGQRETGLPLLRRIIEQQHAVGALVSLSVDYVYLAEHLLADAQYDAAAQALKNGFEVLHQTGERQWETELWRTQADWHQLAQQDHVAAEACYRKALALSQPRKTLIYSLRAAMGLAQMQQNGHALDDGLGLLADCYAQFREGFTTPDLIQAKALLEMQ
ncbi:MAG: ATP-binding protein [Oceanococcus sp.]